MEPDPNGSLYLGFHRVLVHCYEEGHRQTVSRTAHQILDIEGLDEENAETLVERSLDLLADQGLVKLFPTMGSRYAMYDITDTGRIYAAEVLERRARPGYRARVLRTSLLRWLHENEGAAGLSEVPLTHRHVEGSEAGEEELAKVMDDLTARELVRSADEEGSVVLTEQGHRCVENFGGDVSKYEEGRPKAGATYTVNFNGAATGVQVGQGDHNTFNQDNRSEMTEQVRGFLESLEQVRPSLDLDEGSGMELDRAVTSLQELLRTDEPEPTRVGVLLRWIGDVLNKSASQAVSGSVAPLLLAGLNELFAHFPQLLG
ncbi:hypothetical protein [Nocardiopsis sp. NPDC057823]|uniref:hypothetical protein n=1 Tax=Nocardiopsis sp. NPDC057823 TaxID=3346256 RepID=UPI0036723ABA